MTAPQQQFGDRDRADGGDRDVAFLRLAAKRSPNVYFEDEPGRRSAAKLLTKDEARRIEADKFMTYPNSMRLRTSALAIDLGFV